MKQVLKQVGNKFESKMTIKTGTNYKKFAQKDDKYSRCYVIN